MVYKLSIIIPTYNREEYIKKTIDSVIKQTIGFENIELIIIDDNSKDNTQQIINEYAKKYSNIKTKYLNKNSGYPGKPRNIGIELSTANYIIFLDSDDYFEKDACEILYEKINSEKADLVFGTCIIHKLGRTLDGTPEYFKNKGILKFNSKNDEFIKIIELISPQLPKNIFSKEMIEKNKIRFPEGIPAQDAVFIIDSYFSSKSIIYLTDFNVYNYIFHEGSITTTRNIEYFKGVFKAENYIQDIFKNNNREEDYKYHLNRRINFFITQILSNEIKTKEELEDVFKLFSKFFKKISIYNITPKDDLYKIALYLIENNDIDSFNLWKNVNKKVKRLWNINKTLKNKNSNIKIKNVNLKEKNLELVEKNADLREKYWKLREKNADLREKNDLLKEQIKKLQSIKGWIGYKKSNIINMVKK